MKKLCFILLMVGIFQLSNTPGLYVSDPSTWINTPEYEKELPIRVFFLEEGFFLPYRDIYNQEFILHKICHLIFFSMLTWFAYINFKRRYIFAWLFVTCFALLDEIHQAFIVGRSGRALDVLLDSTASLCTVLVLYLLAKYKKSKSSNENK